MSKLIKINDRKPIEIYIGRKTRGPVTGIRLSEVAIGRILRSIDAPKDVYAIGPNNALVKLTLDNYTKSEDELFNIKKEPVAVDDAKAKAEAIRKSLEARKNLEPEVEHKEQEPEEDITEEVTKVIEESEVQNVETVEDSEPVVETVNEEVVDGSLVENVVVEEKKEAPVKNYNNNNNNYKNYNKNYKKR